MNITGYNLETLREKIRNLQEENNKLKEFDSLCGWRGKAAY